MDAEGVCKLGSDHRAVAGKVQLARDDELGEIAHFELERWFDPPDLRGKTLVAELHDHRPLDKRSGGKHSRGLFRSADEVLPLVNQAVVGHEEVCVEAYHLALQFPFKSRHHRHHQNEHRDAQGHPKHGDKRDHRKEGALRLEITRRKEKRGWQTRGHQQSKK